MSRSLFFYMLLFFCGEKTELIHFKYGESTSAKKNRREQTVIPYRKISSDLYIMNITWNRNNVPVSAVASPRGEHCSDSN